MHYNKIAETADLTPTVAHRPLSVGNGRPTLMMADREREMNKMSEFTTAELVEELKRRQGVDARIAEPYEDITVSVNGPAIMLIVTD